jgi:hypothetical protein
MPRLRRVVIVINEGDLRDAGRLAVPAAVPLNEDVLADIAGRLPKGPNVPILLPRAAAPMRTVTQ